MVVAVAVAVATVGLVVTFHGKGAQVWHVLTGDHTVLPATHPFIHKRNEP